MVLKNNGLNLNIGCHLSISKGYEAAGKKALEIGANTFQFFIRNPRGGKAKLISEEDSEALRNIIQYNSFAPLLAHASYTLNLCSSNPNTRLQAQNMMAEDLLRMEQLPSNLYNFHPGSHGGQGIGVGINHIIVALNNVIKEDQDTIILLETMAGKGTEVGSSFEELAAIMKEVHLKDKIGVCLDTCHIHDAGYDIVNDLDGVLERFDQIIGLEKLYAIHLNDSMNVLGSRKDRHHKIGEGTLGLKTFEAIITHPRLQHLPFYLETPNEPEEHALEIELLRNLYKKGCNMNKIPPLEKIYEAYSAIADNRVALESDFATVLSSDYSKQYAVKWDGIVYASNDNSSYWQGYPGYPVIAVLMLQKKIPCDMSFIEHFKRINWKELNKRYKNKYDKSLNEVFDSLRKNGVDVDRIESETDKIWESLKQLNIVIKRNPAKPVKL